MMKQLIASNFYKSEHNPKENTVEISITGNGVTWHSVIVDLDNETVEGDTETKKWITAECCDIPIDDVEAFLTDDQISFDEYLVAQAKNDLEVSEIQDEQLLEIAQ